MPDTLESMEKESKRLLQDNDESLGQVLQEEKPSEHNKVCI